MRLPVYLVRDIENFLKLKNIEKFLWLDMKYFEVEHDYTIIPGRESEPKPESANYCAAKYSQIINMNQEYLDSNKLDNELKEKIISEAYNFRQTLKRLNKKRKKSLDFIEED